MNVVNIASDRRSLDMIDRFVLPEVMTVTATDGPCGFEIGGVDLADDLPGEVIGALMWVFYKSGFVILRGQDRLTPERQAEVTEWFGRTFVRGTMGDGVDKMATVSSTPVQILGSAAEDPDANVAAADADRGGELEPHSDVQDYAIPPAVTVLHGVEVVPTEAGGNTYFANLYQAYDELDTETKRRIEHLKWRPTSTLATAYRVGMKAAKESVAKNGLIDNSDVRHPVVRTHPVTRRKALWLSTFTEEICGLDDPDETEALTRKLKDHVVQDHLWQKHIWAPHDVLIWDNRCMNHWREGWDTSYRRTMHRSQANGSRPF